jgi:hypothetical protein
VEGIIAVPLKNYKNHNNKNNNITIKNCGGGSSGDFACGGDGIVTVVISL